MRRLVLLVLFVSLLLNAVFLVREWRRQIVISVPDGDSIQLADGRRVRLLGIDAPEKNRCMADDARDFLIKEVKGRHVRLKNIVTDDYGRSLALVIREDPETWLSYLRWWATRRFSSVFPFLPSRPSSPSFPSPDPLLNRAMLEQGLARNTFSVTSTSEYAATLKSAAEEAKAAKRGIWSEECRSSKPRAGLEAEACVIKGNVRAGEKRYYVPDCKQYDQVIVDEAFGDGWFCTAKEAAGAGFTPACR